MARVPLKIDSTRTITLSPGGQNVLVKHIIEDFGARFTPGGKILYVGDADEKFAFIDEASLEALGVQLAEHGKMPDVII